MSAANHLEAAIILDGARSPIASRRFDEAVAAAGIIVEQSPRSRPKSPVRPIAISAKAAATRRGAISATVSPTPAKSTWEPLLFKGDDFSHTDVAIA
jgi:ribonuclease VapC